MSKMFAWLGVWIALFAGTVVQATVIDFNVYYAGDAGELTIANKSWVPGMLNIGSGATVIGDSVTVTLPSLDFDSGPTKNYPASMNVTPNTRGVFGLGTQTGGEQYQGFSASILGQNITGITLYFGNYENYDSTPVVWDLANTSSGYSGWSGSVSGQLTSSGLTISGSGDNGVHIFGGQVVTSSASVPEPSTFVLAGLGLAGLSFGALRKKFRRVALS